ncbi:MAG TPA: 23S rRNA (pseudouridine(1915)-N(3))-methyltransferase RlmH [Bdellovibrionota bacterium]|jgi:23S rRNA (pseudouridine1915-N3)-methyltransferase|nr:23S rRNA (pseudouridine(1915)-N(3))-methyltransferase RlmH [Bdellovibrionota bacterium]
MQIYFWLDWYRPSKRLAQEFKNVNSLGLFQEYIERISKFVPIEVGGEPRKLLEQGQTVVLYTDISRSPKDLLSSEDLATWIESQWGAGLSQIVIAVGASDGWRQRARHPNSRTWSFGPMTLPHELAAAVASEQVYRALSIIKKLPYHLGH